jgi:hypothetical protein
MKSVIAGAMLRMALALEPRDAAVDQRRVRRAQPVATREKSTCGREKWRASAT